MCNYSKPLKTTLQITDENIKILNKTEEIEINRFKALINGKSTLPRYMFTAVKTLRKYKRQIKNTMYYNGLSNGLLERINNKIKVIKRISYGYNLLLTLKLKYSLYLAYLRLLKLLRNQNIQKKYVNLFSLKRKK